MLSLSAGQHRRAGRESEGAQFMQWAVEFAAFFDWDGVRTIRDQAGLVSFLGMMQDRRRQFERAHPSVAYFIEDRRLTLQLKLDGVSVESDAVLAALKEVVAP